MLHSEANTRKGHTPGLYSNGQLDNEVSAWVTLFDPETSRESRNAIKAAFRKSMDTALVMQDLTEPFVPKPLNHRELPQDMTVAIVMTGAYNQRWILPPLEAAGIAKRNVLIGYSSGLHARRHFSDRTSMTEKIFAMSEHIRVLERNAQAPLLLVDVLHTTGITYATIGYTLKTTLDYSGPIYQMMGNRAVAWNGKLKGDEAKTLPLDVPIFDENWWN